MNIQDYLPLYLGCQVMSTAGKHMGRLVGISENDAIVTPLDRFDPRVTVPKYLKPIIRPLSDMKPGEADYFAWLCMDSEHHLEEDSRIAQEEIDTELVKYDGGNLLDGDIEIYIGVSVRCFEGAVIIGKDGSISVQDEDGKKEHIDKIAHKVLYLISKGFDLFGLIDGGLAIDCTTI